MQYTNQRRSDSTVFQIEKNRMKHSIKYILMVLLCISLSACGNKEATTETTIETNLTVEEILAVVLGSQELPDYCGLEAFIPGDRGYENYLASNLEQVSEDVEDGVICISSDMEISIFLMKDEESAKESEDLLLAYQESRVNTFTGYSPEMAKIAERGKVVVNGRYVALFICFDSDQAQEAFLSCFEDTPPEIPEEFLLDRETLDDDSQEDVTEITTEETPASEEELTGETASDTDDGSANDVSDTYDHDAVLLAWETGDTSNLSEKNLDILKICKYAIEYEISDDMTEYEKELAIHDWMIEWADYDTAHTSVATMDECNPDNDNPYGFLIGKKGICLGYATTFQLFMDMLQIECITVEGHARITEDHAWNLVQLDGEWYCVDVTWDDPIFSGTVSEEMAHIYFNVTSDFMRLHDHQWNADEVEEAEGTTYSWKPDR